MPPLVLGLGNEAVHARGVDHLIINSSQLHVTAIYFDCGSRKVRDKDVTARRKPKNNRLASVKIAYQATFFELTAVSATITPRLL